MREVELRVKVEDKDQLGITCRYLEVVKPDLRWSSGRSPSEIDWLEDDKIDYPVDIVAFGGRLGLIKSGEPVPDEGMRIAKVHVDVLTQIQDHCRDLGRNLRRKQKEARRAIRKLDPEIMEDGYVYIELLPEHLNEVETVLGEL